MSEQDKPTTGIMSAALEAEIRARAKLLHSEGAAWHAVDDRRALLAHLDALHAGPEGDLARAVEHARRITASGAVDDGTLLSRALLASRAEIARLTTALDATRAELAEARRAVNLAIEADHDAVAKLLCEHAEALSAARLDGAKEERERWQGIFAANPDIRIVAPRDTPEIEAEAAKRGDPWTIEIVGRLCYTVAATFEAWSEENDARHESASAEAIDAARIEGARGELARVTSVLRARWQAEDGYEGSREVRRAIGEALAEMVRTSTVPPDMPGLGRARGVSARVMVCPVCEGTGEMDPDDTTHPDHPDQTGDGPGDYSCLACRDDQGVSHGRVTREEYDLIPENERAAVRRGGP